MVIDIILENGKKLILEANTQIEWVRENMFFEKDVQLRGKFSYPFSINREANSEVLNFPDLIEAQLNAIKIGATVNIFGNEFYKGQINILDWDDTMINISISRNTDSFNTDLYIDELDLGVYVDIADFGSRNADRAKVYPEVDYAFPQFYNYNKENIEKYGTQANESTFILVNWQNGNTEDALGEEIAIPMFYVLSVLDKILKNFGIALKSLLINNEDFKKKLIFNTTVPRDDVQYVGTIHLNPDWNYTEYAMVFATEDLDIPVGTIYSFRVVEWNYSAIVNQFDVVYTVTSMDIAGGTSAILQSIRDEILTVATNTVVIGEYYTGTISRDNPFGFNLQFNNGNRIAIVFREDNIVSVNQLTAGTTPGEPNELFTRQYLPYKIGTILFETNVLLQKHLPHITVSEFLIALKNTFNLSIDMDELNDVMVVNFRNAYISDVLRQDFTYALLEGTEGNVEVPENIVIEMDNDSDRDELAKDLPITANNYPQASMSPSTVIQTNSGAPKIELLRNSNSGVRNQATVDMLFGDYIEKADFGLRFLHCHGYALDSAGFRSVFADNTGLTPNEVYTQYYKDWYELMLTLRKAPTYYFNFGMVELKSNLPAIWRVKYTDFVWKRMTTVIHNTKGILPTRVEGYRR